MNNARVNRHSKSQKENWDYFAEKVSEEGHTLCSLESRQAKVVSENDDGSLNAVRQGSSGVVVVLEAVDARKTALAVYVAEEEGRARAAEAAEGSSSSSSSSSKSAVQLEPSGTTDLNAATSLHFTNEINSILESGNVLFYVRGGSLNAVGASIPLHVPADPVSVVAYVRYC